MSNEIKPKYTSSPRVERKEKNTFIADISTSMQLTKRPIATLSMYFGQYSIKVKVVGKNF